jgi:hypothetical protein
VVGRRRRRRRTNGKVASLRAVPGAVFDGRTLVGRRVDGKGESGPEASSERSVNERVGDDEV